MRPERQPKPALIGSRLQLATCAGTALKFDENRLGSHLIPRQAGVCLGVCINLVNSAIRQLNYRQIVAFLAAMIWSSENP